MQCWLVLCGKRKMIFTSSRSRLSITTPHPPEVCPNYYTARLLALDTAAPSFAGDSRTLNLQAGVRNEPFACHALSKQNPTASCKARKTFLQKKASNIWACGKENSLRTAKFIAFVRRGKSASPLARRSLAPVHSRI